LIEKGKALMHCGNTTFAYSNEFKDYIKVDGAESKNIFDYLLLLVPGNSYQNKGKNISLNYLKNGT